MLTATRIAPFSKEQYNYLTQSTARINIAHGPVRSGKNFIENVRLVSYLASEPHGDRHSAIAFCGASINAIYNIFLSDLFDIIGAHNYEYNAQNGSGTIYGRPFQCFPCQKAGDFKRLRGRTLGGALITEGTLCDQEFFNELLARLSVAGSKLFVDTNPAGPYHWLYTDFIRNEDLKSQDMVREFNFNFDSNLSLSDEYKDSLKAYYGPGTLWYQRMIEGKWVMADGLVYSAFDPRKHVIDPSKVPHKCLKPSVGYDYGTSNPFAGVQGQTKNGIWYLTRELYYDGRERGQLADTQKADHLIKWLDSQSRFLYIDPSAASFKAELRTRPDFKRKRVRLRDADNSVNEGIEHINSLFASNKLYITSDMLELIKELGIYAWDANAAKRGIDKPKKDNDHACDAMRYLIHSQHITKPTGGANWTR